MLTDTGHAPASVKPSLIGSINRAAKKQPIRFAFSTRAHETRMVTDTAFYDPNLPPQLFPSQALADEGLESECHP